MKWCVFSSDLMPAASKPLTLAVLKERGAPRVVLSTASQNAAAQRLFERAGFRRTMIEMTRELPDDSCGLSA